MRNAKEILLPDTHPFFPAKHGLRTTPDIVDALPKILGIAIDPRIVMNSAERMRVSCDLLDSEIHMLHVSIIMVEDTSGLVDHKEFTTMILSIGLCPEWAKIVACPEDSAHHPDYRSRLAEIEILRRRKCVGWRGGSGLKAFTHNMFVGGMERKYLQEEPLWEEITDRKDLSLEIVKAIKKKSESLEILGFRRFSDLKVHLAGEASAEMGRRIIGLWKSVPSQKAQNCFDNPLTNPLGQLMYDAFKAVVDNEVKERDFIVTKRDNAVFGQ